MEKQRLSPREYIPLVVLLVLTCAIVLAIALAPRTPEVQTEYYSDYFDTVSSVSDYSDKNDFRMIADLVGQRLAEYHALFDIYGEQSDVRGIAYLNSMAGKGSVSLDPTVIDFLLYAIEMHSLTDGEVNIAMGAVLSVWHDYREDGVALPDAALLAERNLHTDISVLRVDAERGTAEITDPEASLDVGAIAKGYATDLIRRELISIGVSGVVLDIGGNLSVVGAKPDGSGWRTGIINPDRSSPDRYVTYLTVKDTSVVTSGNYERYYEVDGVRYHHLIDKDTLMPATAFSSVTVITENSALADALSTALFLMDVDSCRSLVTSLEGVEAILITSSGELIELR